jgi:hypothetical protein
MGDADDHLGYAVRLPVIVLMQHSACRTLGCGEPTIYLRTFAQVLS